MTWWSLLGSGEFLPWSEVADRWLLERADGDGRVLVLPAASAPEGRDVFDRWGSLGLAHFGRLGVPAEVVDLRTREDADDPRIVDRLDGASVAYFSGGNPAYLASILRETVFLDRLLHELGRGMGYAGCSAGVACLNETTFDSDTMDLSEVFRPGLGLVPRTLFSPHWDIVDTWIEGAGEFIVGTVPQGHTFVGLDEETAMLGDGASWEVAGRGAIHVMRDGGWREHRGGARFELPLMEGVAR